MSTTKRPRRPAGQRAKLFTGTAYGAFEGGQSELAGLKEEITEWKENLEGNGMDHLPKFEEVSECADAMETVMDALDGLEFPEHLQDLEVSYTQDTRQSANSRNGRLANALSQIDAARSAVEQWLEDHETLEANEGEEIEVDEDGPLEDRVTEADAAEREEQRDAAQELLDELVTAYDNAEGVSFPGMY